MNIKLHFQYGGVLFSVIFFTQDINPPVINTLIRVHHPLLYITTIGISITTILPCKIQTIIPNTVS